MNSYLPHYLKLKNTSLIFNIIRSRKTTSRAELVRLTGMSFPTVLKIIDQLLSLKIVIELDEIEDNRGAGRRGHLLQFNPLAFYAIGLEFDGKTLNAGLVDLNGTSQYSHSTRIADSNQLSSIEQGFIIEINNLLCHARREQKNVLGIGIGLPAIINSEKKEIFYMEAYNILSPTPFDSLFKRLYSSFSAPVFIGNDVNFSCLGESFLRRSDPAYNNLLFVTLSTGLGAGIMMNGTIWEGSNHNAGEIGQMYLCDPATFSASSPNIEKLINIDFLSQKFHIDFRGSAILSSSQIEEVCDYLCPYLSVLLINQAHLLDINNVVVSGAVPEALGYTFFEKLQSRLDETLRYIPITVEPSLTRDAGIIGAAVYVFNNVLNQLFQEKTESP